MCNPILLAWLIFEFDSHNWNWKNYRDRGGRLFMHSKTEILDSTDPRMRGVGIWGILGKPAVGPVGLHRPNFVWLKNSSPVP